MTLRANGIAVSHRRTRRHLGPLKAGYRRTSQTVRHKQDSEKVGRAVPTSKV